MEADRVVAAMSYGEPNTRWAERTAATLDATFVLVLDGTFTEGAPEKTLENRRRSETQC